MKTELVEIKSKSQIVGELEYSFPETLEESIQVDGADKVYKLYILQRKVRAIDAQRRVLTGGGLPKQIVAALKNADPAVLAKIMAELNVDLN